MDDNGDRLVNQAEFLSVNYCERMAQNEEKDGI